MFDFFVGVIDLQKIPQQSWLIPLVILINKPVSSLHIILLRILKNCFEVTVTLKEASVNLNNITIRLEVS